MGRKPKKPKQEPMPPSAQAAKRTTKDRHKPGSRKSVHLPPDLYSRLQAIARKHRRPLSWEAQVMAEEYCDKHDGGSSQETE